MIKRPPGWLFGIAFASLLAAGPARAQEPATTAELKKDIEALRDTLKAMQKDLQEIKTLLQARQAPPAPPQNVVLDLGTNPAMGERTAKLTLVEFSDYQ